jgi:putative sulfotransferase
MKKPLFIVGTGRCGSTLLSKMIKQHPTCLSVSEFFPPISDLGFRIDPVFQPTPISGEQFWQLIATSYPREDLLFRHGIIFDEVLYRMDATSRYNQRTGLPAILRTMLPHLTDKPEDLFDELHTWSLKRPSASPIEHCQVMFQYLAYRFGKTHWVERSGGSIRIVQQFVENFPEARFLHLVRDGRDCAISMSRHGAFRMVLICFQQMQLLGIDPFESDDRTGIANLTEELRCLLPENFTAEAFWNCNLSPALFGHYWSGEIKLGVDALCQLPQERVLTLYFEDVINNPMPQIQALAKFLDDETLTTPEVEQWIQQSVSLVGKPRSQWENLPLQEREELHQACLPGFEILQAYI